MMEYEIDVPWGGLVLIDRCGIMNIIEEENGRIQDTSKGLYALIDGV